MPNPKSQHESKPSSIPQDGDVHELRAVLFDEIRKLRNEQTTASSVSAISNAAGKIFSSIKLEMEFCRQTGRTPNLHGLFPMVEKQQTKSLE